MCIPRPRRRRHPCAVCSGLAAVELGKSPVVVGERLNPTGKKRLKQALLEGDMDYIMAQAVQQEEDGAQILDVNVGLPGLNEAEMMPRVIRAVQSVSTLPIQIDSSDPAAIEAGLRAVNGRAIVNSVNGEPASLEAVLPLVKRYGAVVIGLTLDENGIPETAEGRTAIARRILERCDSLGIPRRDVVMDCVTMPVGSDPNSGAVTLAAVSAVHAMGVKTSLGVSNVSFGLPRRDVLNRTFYAMALGSGLDLAILNPGDVGMMETVCSYRLLSGWDEGGQNYVDRFAGTTAPVAVAAATAAPGAPEKKSADPLTDAVLAGLAEGAAQAAEQMLREMEPQELIDKAIIPVLDEVGRRYEAGTLFLPQLMRSADAAKAACDVVRQVLASKGSVPDGEPIVIATVKGDIHDIGKNIVRAVLENYGYRIIDLGRDVPPETVVKAVRESGSQAVRPQRPDDYHRALHGGDHSPAAGELSRLPGDGGRCRAHRRLGGKGRSGLLCQGRSGQRSGCPGLPGKIKHSENAGVLSRTPAFFIAVKAPAGPAWSRSPDTDRSSAPTTAPAAAPDCQDGTKSGETVRRSLPQRDRRTTGKPRP